MPYPVEVQDASPRDEPLAAALETLASPVRLALLRHLRVAKALREIEVKPADASEDAPARNLARQTVREHLERLMRIGVVVTRDAQRDYGPTVEYQLNHQALFALAEEFRELARLRPAAEHRAATMPRGRPARPLALQGPCLVLVKGLDEGRTFDLTPPVDGPRTWTIGRRRDAEVALDFDPFVSTENALVSWDGGAHGVRDLPESRNGTTLNFETLPGEGTRPLRTGDLIGVGRCILMFRG